MFFLNSFFLVFHFLRATFLMPKHGHGQVSHKCLQFCRDVKCYFSKWNHLEVTVFTVWQQNGTWHCDSHGNKSHFCLCFNPVFTLVLPLPCCSTVDTCSVFSLWLVCLFIPCCVIVSYSEFFSQSCLFWNSWFFTFACFGFMHCPK